MRFDSSRTGLVESVDEESGWNRGLANASTKPAQVQIEGLARQRARSSARSLSDRPEVFCFVLTT
jgi:hypothetical protein